MGTLGAKTSHWQPPSSGAQDTCPTCHALDTSLETKNSVFCSGYVQYA